MAVGALASTADSSRDSSPGLSASGTACGVEGTGVPARLDRSEAAELMEFWRRRLRAVFPFRFGVLAPFLGMLDRAGES